MEEKVDKSEKLSVAMARVVRQRVKSRNKEITQAIEERKNMMDTESLNSDNEIEEENQL